MQAVGGLYQWSICEGSWRESIGVDEGRWCYYIASGDVSNLKKNGFGRFWILATATTRMWRVFSSFFPYFLVGIKLVNDDDWRRRGWMSFWWGGRGWLHRQQCFKMTKFLEINQIKKMISIAFFWNTTTLKNKMFFLQMFSIENILQWNKWNIVENLSYKNVVIIRWILMNF